MPQPGAAGGAGGVPQLVASGAGGVPQPGAAGGAGGVPQADPGGKSAPGAGCGSPAASALDPSPRGN